MTIETYLESEQQQLIIKVSGRFDFSMHQVFRKATEQININHIKHIIIDMKETDYIDSSALGMLLVLRDKMGEDREAVSINNAKPEVRKILDIANFNKLFSLSNN
ncbi:MAG: hypothetical protein RL637_205 [Pseudomonadota bacterium]|jgi:anti-anti-sigma factor